MKNEINQQNMKKAKSLLVRGASSSHLDRLAVDRDGGGAPEAEGQQRARAVQTAPQPHRHAGVLEERVRGGRGAAEEGACHPWGGGT
jgi:hypothetical protein